MAGEGLPPEPTSADRGHLGLLYFFLRVQLPALRFAREAFDTHLARAFGVYLPKAGKPVSWDEYLGALYPLDWAVCVGCLEGSNAAWDLLFAARTGRSDSLLVDALRARAARLYPRDEEKQETAVTEFWSHLLVPDGEGSLPVLARYDGQRPLAPWLIRVFQNRHLSHLRKHPGPQALPDDDLAVLLPTRTKEDDRWHQAFSSAAPGLAGRRARRRTNPARPPLEVQNEPAGSGHAPRRTRRNDLSPERQTPRPCPASDRRSARCRRLDRRRSGTIRSDRIGWRAHR